MEIEDFFIFFKFDASYFLEPPGVQRCYVPHFKGLICGNLKLTAQRCDSILTFHHTLLKKAILQGKRVNRPNIFSSTFFIFII